jgi:hypothetical protein
VISDLDIRPGPARHQAPIPDPPMGPKQQQQATPSNKQQAPTPPAMASASASRQQPPRGYWVLGAGAGAGAGTGRYWPRVSSASSGLWPLALASLRAVAAAWVWVRPAGQLVGSQVAGLELGSFCFDPPCLQTKNGECGVRRSSRGDPVRAKGTRLPARLGLLPLEIY